MAKKPQTIVINNFGGRLTRIPNGDMNSGFSKFDTSWGYNPFTKPGNLTWFNQPTSVAGLEDVVVGGTIQMVGLIGVLGSTPFVVGASGKVYQISVPPSSFSLSQSDPQTSIVGISSVSGDYSWGASAKFFGAVPRLYIAGSGTIVTTGSAIGINSFVLNGSSNTVASAAGIVQATYHPLEVFGGKLVFGNGPSIGVIDATGTVTSSLFSIDATRGPQYSQLNPPLPANNWVWDLDKTPDGNYLQISASDVRPPYIDASLGLAYLDAVSSANPGEGGVYGWNGVEPAATTFLTVPAGRPISLINYLQQQHIFLSDAFGAGLADLSVKKLTLTDNKPPFAQSVSSTGNFLAWANPEVLSDGEQVASFYYYGGLDEENPGGLYRLLRYKSTLSEGQVFQVPYQAYVKGALTPLTSSITGHNYQSYGTHLISVYSTSSTFGSATIASTSALLNFNVTSSAPYSPVQGIYETQTQLFSKRISVSQIRVYCEPTVTGNGFRLDLIGADGTPLPDGTFNYLYGEILDPQSGSAAVERINFPGNIKTQFALGVRITNTGTTNMTIKKVELDISEEGK